MTAYYNDNDPFAAAWLRELIKADLIAPGEVDERSIEEVMPDDLRGFTQCHFFAGVGVWSYALRGAGWPDDEPVWTGSCPCPPFSSVGIKKACPRCEGTNPVPHVGRTGYFVCCLCDHEWFADARHLWPELWRLISVRRPDAFFGEQVAGGDGKTWLASVRASLEILGYAVGAADLCSAGVGASDIRQRLFFVGESDRTGSQPRNKTGATVGHGSAALPASSARTVVNTKCWGRNGRQDLAKSSGGGNGHFPESASGESAGTAGESESDGRIGRQNNGDEGRRQCSLRQASEVEQLGDTGIAGSQGHGRLVQQHDPQGRQDKVGRSAATSGVIELAHADSLESSNGGLQRGRRLLQPSENPLAGFWRDAEWIYCRDEKWRPVEPGTFPLATGVTNRVGRLRGYGNAINAEVAKAFIEAYMSL